MVARSNIVQYSAHMFVQIRVGIFLLLSGDTELCFFVQFLQVEEEQCDHLLLLFALFVFSFPKISAIFAG